LKGDLEAVLDLTAEGATFTFERTEHSALHPGQSAAILRNGEVIGHIGVIHPSLEKKLGLKSRAVMFELELDKLTPAKVPVAAEVSKFPANRRDIAVVVDRQVLAGDVLAVIKKVGGNQVVGINLFDVYQGAGMAEDKKSLAISLVLQDTQRTLEEKEIAETVDNVVRALGEELNASLRD
jgi:phenylalanyl-tRNA synthetase beta chain